MRNGFGWWRLAKQVVLGVQRVVSYAHSTFTAGTWAFTANGATASTDTLTVRDTAGDALGGVTVVFTDETTFVDAATCTLATNDDEIETTTGEATITAHIYNAEGTPLPGIPAASLSLASSGVSNTITAVDTVTDRNGRFRWTFSSTSAAAKTLTLTALGIVVTDTVAVTVTGTPGLISPLFAADWRTATGTSNAATSDTSGVASATGPGFTIDGGANDVVANSGLGFTVGSTNVLRVPGDTGGILRKTGLGTQAVGDTRYYFIEARWDLPNGTVDTQTHPFQDGDAGGFVHEHMFYNNFGDDVVGYRIGFQPTQTPASDYQWRCPFNLAKGTVYRFGWAVTYTSTTQFTFEIRVWDTSGTLLASDDGVGATHGAFYNESTSETLADANAGGGFNVGTRSISESGGYNVGTNDVYPEFAPTYGYQSTFAIADNQGWITQPSDVDGF